jgi:aspartyl-tRNA(Asn)/glutamyl-tRNA(Gln) amidotransferase subunit A
MMRITKKAMKVRTLLIQDFEEAFKQVDVLVTPASPSMPWKLGEKTDDPLKMYLSDIFTVHANLVGVPGMSVPAGFHPSASRRSSEEDSGQAGLPIGMQILGPHFREDLLFQVAHTYEMEHPWWKEKPEL